MSKKTKTMTVEKIAQVAHEVNQSYCHSMGDFSQLPWIEAPQWQKDSALLGVNFHIEHPEAGPDASHNSWMQQKIDTGWVYGKIKDEVKKTHPCIMPFDELPEGQKAKDYLFRQIVHSLKDQLV